MSLRITLLATLVFFVLCLGLGYQGVSRYDPRKSPDVWDSTEYHSLTLSMDFAASRAIDDSGDRPRILVPLVAKAVHALLPTSTGRAEPVLLSLLVANSMFCALAAALLVHLAVLAGVAVPVGLLAATLYLLNFATSNFFLSALVDSAEAASMLVLVWALYTGRWKWLPLVGAIGVCGKETFLPFAVTFAAVWWLSEYRGGRASARQGAWVAGLAIGAAAAFVALWSSWYHTWVFPWDVATSQHQNNQPFVRSLWHCLASREFLWVFGWLLPLCLAKLGQLPRPWVLAAFVTGLEVVLLGAWDAGNGNFVRALFSVSAAPLSLSVALLLTDPSRDPPRATEKVA